MNRDETVYYITECSKLAQKKCKNKHDWVENVIYWEVCKKLKSDQIIKWYMHKRESILENETHKIVWDFEILTENLISARRPDLVTMNKKKNKRSWHIVDFDVQADHIEKKQRKWKEIWLLWHCLGTKKAVEYDSDGSANCNCYA